MKLEYLLRSYTKGEGEAGRKALHRRIYGILWVSCKRFCFIRFVKSLLLQYGSGKTLGAKEGVTHPSYVYPLALKGPHPDVVKDWSDPEG